MTLQSTYQYLYTDVGNGVTYSIGLAPFSMHYEDNPLSVDDYFRVYTGHGNDGTYRYVGSTDNNEPGFSIYASGTEATRFFSNTYYPDGTAWPTFFSEQYVSCFLTGTMIATRTGSISIEDLKIGDFVLTFDGREAQVTWLGRQAVVAAFGPQPAHWPVQIHAGAFGEGMPARSLRVTTDHALLLDGVLVQAGALVNGTTIRRMTATELGERYTVFHVETENHELILAEGVAAETFVDNVTRRRFDNYAEYAALYGDTDARIAEIALPRVKSARQLPRAIRQRLADRAAVLGIAASKAA